MKRRKFDRIVSLVGFGLSIFLLVAAVLLNWGATFAGDTVKSQLEAQQISIPSNTGNPDASAEVIAFFKANGSEDGSKIIATGKQAQMYADYFLAFHLSGMPAYSKATGANRAAAAALAANPTDPALIAAAAKASGVVETVFKGTMLRGTLLTAYAFGTLGSIAGYGTWAALIGGVLMFFLSVLGFLHLRRTDPEATV